MSRPSDKTSVEPIYSTMLYGCPELWDVVDQFARELPQRVDELEAAFRNESLDRLSNSARSLTKAGREHGFPVLADRAAAIERLASDAMLESVDSQLTELRMLVKQIRAGAGPAASVDESSRTHVLTTPHPSR